jgi:SAM-dependent methyltransferase
MWELKMAYTVSSVQSHYRSDDLAERILSAVEATGADIAKPTAETFFTIDQLHGGGLPSTKLQAELAGASDGMRILDAGFGVGGASRYLAYSHGCQVEAMDLTQEFVDAAVRLTELCGLADKINFRQGDVTELPFEAQSFDIVWCQNVTMNIEDKPRLFAEAYRVLKPGGRYTFSHAAGVAGGGPYFPLPWAREPEYSFLGTEGEILGWLDAAGFEVLENRSEGGGAGGGSRPEGIGPSLIMGNDFPERAANAGRSASDGLLKSMLVVAERPA